MDPEWALLEADLDVEGSDISGNTTLFASEGALLD
jgi:hypothetical protein